MIVYHDIYRHQHRSIHQGRLVCIRVSVCGGGGGSGGNQVNEVVLKLCDKLNGHEPSTVLWIIALLLHKLQLPLQLLSRHVLATAKGKHMPSYSHREAHAQLSSMLWFGPGEQPLLKDLTG